MNRSRSTLFLIELLIVTAIFAICAAICVKLLAGSYLMADESRNKSSALRLAQSAAEYFKASGDTAKASASLGGTDNEIYYDNNWRICGANAAVYILTFTDKPPEVGAEALNFCEISVKKAAGVEIVALTVAARGDTA